MTFMHLDCITKIGRFLLCCPSCFFSLFGLLMYFSMLTWHFLPLSTLFDLFWRGREAAPITFLFHAPTCLPCFTVVTSTTAGSKAWVLVSVCIHVCLCLSCISWNVYILKYFLHNECRIVIGCRHSCCNNTNVFQSVKLSTFCSPPISRAVQFCHKWVHPQRCMINCFLHLCQIINVLLFLVVFWLITKITEFGWGNRILILKQKMDRVEDN